ncbi:DNA-binding response regulator [Virgisporangium aliadipatigenens]|uniref:DNA-binding response regulator n=1 Tax=Virgisporangium aliadipatigenens TaxID=741659 RepID=A0A8J4DUS2_9ACTN|nr:response regulator transcription factor [Virgisporangium aliadipatigenens]GIJ50383.1 DNA-binding response regulator [Virgisporangium aliadipatigenens]
MIDLLLADDQVLVRTGFRMILENADDMRVVGEAGDGAQAVRLALDLRPDVVLMDVRMPGLDGVDATRRICAENAVRQTRVLILTTFDLDEYVFAAVQAGASGFLLKDTLAADLLSAIRVVARGDAVVAPSVTRRLLERYADTGSAVADTAVLDTLTGREREVLGLVARGLSNSEIAGRLYLSEGTVKTYVSRVLAKLGVRDRVQAVVFAYECGLVRAGSG